MSLISLCILTVFLFLSFTVDADFNSTLLLANQGDATAQNQLGESYYKGEGVTKTDTEAFKWFKLAADQGNVNAQKHLGNMYYYGVSVPQSYTEAVKWYRLDADQGNASAQSQLELLKGLEIESTVEIPSKIIKGIENDPLNIRD